MTKKQESDLTALIYNVDRARFVPDARAGTITSLQAHWASDQIGFLDLHISLSEILAIGITEDQAIAWLDSKVDKRQLKVFRISIPKVAGRSNDLLFAIETGCALYGLLPPLTARVIKVASFYNAHPLSAEAYAFGSVALTPSIVVARLRAELEESKIRRFGLSVDGTLEQRLHRASILEDVKLKAAIYAAANNSKKR